MAKSKKKYKFKGYDYSEIFEALELEEGVYFPKEMKCYQGIESQDKLNDLRVAIARDWCSKSIANESKVADIFKRYFEEFLPMEKKMHYHYPMWLGLSKIKDQQTFLKYCFVLILFMWN